MSGYKILNIFLVYLQVEAPTPGAIWVEVLTAKFTPKQLETLKCQMTQHVQLLLTSWLLCSGSSAMENVAEDYLNILVCNILFCFV